MPTSESSLVKLRSDSIENCGVLLLLLLFLLLLFVCFVPLQHIGLVSLITRTAFCVHHFATSVIHTICFGSLVGFCLFVCLFLHEGSLYTPTHNGFFFFSSFFSSFFFFLSFFSFFFRHSCFG